MPKGNALEINANVIHCLPYVYLTLLYNSQVPNNSVILLDLI